MPSGKKKEGEQGRGVHSFNLRRGWGQSGKRKERLHHPLPLKSKKEMNVFAEKGGGLLP